ncbi:Uncharacterised protein [Mycobacteroides abscessus subsp. abscessus]|nr:Uncharacterised protein [Mycobacteroides abscessus subsp. abscessus]SKY80491.1 Uncharacterised protein [Mycobacteroides abscessus subsp. abscessus]
MIVKVFIRRAITRSDFTESCARSTALSGGGPGLIAHQATCRLDSTMYQPTVNASRIMETTCRRPSTGSRGIGSRTVMTSATNSPLMVLATEKLPQSIVHTSMSHTNVQARSTISRGPYRASRFIAVHPRGQR